MTAPKPITLTAGSSPSPGQEPQPFVIVGGLPGIEPQEAPVIDDTPASEAAVAADLQAVVDALIAAGIFTEAE